MKKYIFISIFLCSLISSIKAQELTLDQILEKHFKATGYDKMMKINTIVMTGFMTKETIMPFKIIKMRPDKYKMENDVQDVYTCQSYDGQTGWQIITPWTGNSKPIPLSPEATKDIKAKADFDGTIYKWKEKGHKAEVIGKEMLNDNQVYKIALTRKDSIVENYYIDCNDFLLKGKSRKIKRNGQEIENVSIYSNFMEVEGVIFPFTNQNLFDGQQYSLIEYEKIEVNISLDEKIFKMS